MSWVNPLLLIPKCNLLSVGPHLFGLLSLATHIANCLPSTDTSLQLNFEIGMASNRIQAAKVSLSVIPPSKKWWLREDSLSFSRWLQWCPQDTPRPSVRSWGTLWVPPISCQTECFKNKLFLLLYQCHR